MKREQKEVRDGAERHQQSIPALCLIQTFRFNLSFLEEASWWHEAHLCKHKWETVLWKHFAYLYSFNKHHPFYHFPEILHAVTHFNILTAIIIMLLVTTSGRKKCRWYLQNVMPSWETGTLRVIQSFLGINLSPEHNAKTKMWSLSQGYESWSLSKTSEHLVSFLCWHTRNYTDWRRDRKKDREPRKLAWCYE